MYDMVEEYDPATDVWTTKTPIPTGRESAAVAVVDERVVVIGGWGRDPNSWRAVEAYDPPTDSWEQFDGLPADRGYHTSTVVGDTLVSVGGIGLDPQASSGAGPLATVETLNLRGITPGNED